MDKYVLNCALNVYGYILMYKHINKTILFVNRAENRSV